MIGRLIINGQQVDLDEAVPFPISFSIADVKNPQKRVRSGSKTIRLPGTSLNRRVFASARLLSLSDIDGLTGFDFDPTRRVPAQYYRGNLKQFDGLCELQEVELVGEEVYFNILLLSSSKDIFLQLENVRINELGWDEYDHVLNRTNIKNSWDTSVMVNGTPTSNFIGASPKGFGYLYGLVNWGYNQFETRFSTTDIIPGVYFKEIVEKCMDYVGVTVTSNFLNSSLFKRLVLFWEGGPKIGISPAEAALRNVVFSAAISKSGSDAHSAAVWSSSTMKYTVFYPQSFSQYNFDTISTITINNDPINQFDAANKRITIARKGNYRLLITGSIGGKWDFSTNPDSYSGDVILHFSILKNNYPISFNFLNLSKGVDQYLNFNATVDLSLDIGDIVGVRVRVTSSLQAIWSGNAANIPTLNISLNDNNNPLNFNLSAIDSLLTDGDTVNLSRFVSTMKAVDFINDLIKAFNLYISEPDVNNNIIIEPFEDYYVPNEIVRVRDKIDYSKPRKIKPTASTDGKTYAFKWAEDQDYYNKVYRTLFGIGYGDFNYDIESSYATGVKEYKMKMAQSYPVEYDNSAGLIVPMVINYDETNGQVTPYKGSPRPFVYNGLQPASWRLSNDINYNPNDPATFEDLAYYPQLNHLLDLSNADFDLNFGVPLSFGWNPTKYTNNNLWKYHERFIKEITSKDGKIYEVYIRWTDEDIAKLDFRKLIEDNGVLYRLNNIADYDPDKKESTLTELVKIVNIEVPGAIDVGGNMLPHSRDNFMSGGDDINGSDTAPDVVSGGDNTVEASTIFIQIR